MTHPHQTAPKLITLIPITGLSVASLNLFLPSLPNIAREFDATFAQVNTAIAGYAAATALLQLVVGPLSDRYGRKPVILGALAIFVLASIGCIYAPDIRTFLFFRLMQAAVISCFVVSMAVIRDSFSEQKSASLLGYLATAWALAPMLAPILGGFLDSAFGWRSGFWLFSGLGLLFLIQCTLTLKETNRRPAASLLGQLRGYPSLLRSRRFQCYTLCMAASNGAFYTFLGGAPLVAASVFGLSPDTVGLVLGSITAGFVFGSFLSGRYSGHFPVALTVLAGRLTACLGLVAGLIILLTGQPELTLYFGSCLFVGIGNGLSLPGCSTSVMSVDAGLAGSASGLAGALTVAGGATASAITGLVLTPENAAVMLLIIMLACSALGLVSILLIRRNPQPEPAVNRS